MFKSDPNTFVSQANSLFDDLPDQSIAAARRKLWPSQSPSGKMIAAWLQFLEPTRQIWSFQVSDPKYIKKTPLDSLDVVKLLSEGSSEEAVLYELKVATNTEARRELYIKMGAPMSVLKEVGLEPEKSSGPTNSSPQKPTNK